MPLVVVLAGPNIPFYPPNVKSYNLITNDLMYDPLSHVTYASVPLRAGWLGNSIMPIDFAQGKFGRAIFVGSQPNKLALSDDKPRFYVGLDGEASLARLDTASGTAAFDCYLGSNSYDGPYRVLDLAVLPGQPHWLPSLWDFRMPAPAFDGRF